MLPISHVTTSLQLGLFMRIRMDTTAPAKSPCNQTPDAPGDAPTRNARMPRGSRYWKMISRRRSSGRSASTLEPARTDRATTPTAAGIRKSSATRLGILFTEDPRRFLQPVREARGGIHVMLFRHDV